MTGPVAFGLARLAEEEARARAALEAAPGRWHAAGEDIIIRTPDQHWDGACVAGAHHPFDAHIAGHDPYRELRDIENKRALLADYGMFISFAEELRASGQDAGNGVLSEIKVLERAVRRLIARWDDHPEYEADAWKP